MKGRTRSSANLAPMCQPRARATPCQLGAGSLPSSSRDSCLVTGAHLQPAQATPGEAVASACTWLRAITSLHPLLPHPSYLGDHTSSYSPNPPPTGCVLTLDRRFTAAGRQWTGPGAPLPTSPNLYIWKHLSAREGNEHWKVNLDVGPLLH